MGNQPIKRVLVLSGGGARGAYQVGVCKHLYSKGWEPDMVLGNSIGSTNGAILVAPNYGAVQDQEEAIASPVDLLEYVWLNRMTNFKLYTPFRPLLLKTIDVIRDPEGHPDAFEDLVQAVLDAFGPEITEFTEQIAAAARADGLSEKEVTRGLLKLVVGLIKKILALPALIPRPGWRRVLEDYVKYVDVAKLSSPEVPYLGIASTDIATGALEMFWNRMPPGMGGVETNTQVRHVMSSSSIPAIYRATKAEAGRGVRRYRWDGALVANTPIAPALDIISSVERIIVVLMTPWFEDPEDQGLPLPQEEPTVADALKRFPDWMMLAPLRSELRRLDAEKRDKISIVWPKKLATPGSSIDYLTNPVSMIDYRKRRTQQLIEEGYNDAKDLLKGIFKKDP